MPRLVIIAGAVALASGLPSMYTLDARIESLSSELHALKMEKEMSVRSKGRNAFYAADKDKDNQLSYRE
jgi:hypothetical protein